jgi:hypothetical protein
LLYKFLYNALFVAFYASAELGLLFIGKTLQYKVLYNVLGGERICQRGVTIFPESTIKPREPPSSALNLGSQKSL